MEWSEHPDRKPFGYYVFDDKAMEKHVPDAAYKAMKKFILKGGVLDAAVADSVAFGMKEWAMSKGATSFTHWFHPLNNKSGVKYDAFLTLKNHLGYNTGRNLSQFTGSQLVQGEPDGSSFPNGGLRKTAEARGYTAWDYTSPPFVMTSDLGGCLYIPAVFCSIFGLSLDLRTPLLKSEFAIGQESIRAIGLINKVMGIDKPAPSSVYVTVGPEQEIFLIDRELFLKRPDLIHTGRVLVGAAPLKGQQLEDHYWGKMPPRVKDCLRDIRDRLWELGVPVTTAHNEVAPAQFEMASCFERASVASDHNMVTMAVMEEQAEKHGLALLIHEKPFYRYVNGSGKHTNWSLATSDGVNLLSPPETEDPRGSAQFLFFLAAFLRGAHVHTDVLRTAIAVPGNEFRLGGMEAPPAIISVFLGKLLASVVADVIEGRKSSEDGKSPCGFLDLGLGSLPQIKLDPSDRNRTSPLAFTSNRFEFRAVGSSQNCAWPITVMNVIMAESIQVMVDEIEKLISEGIDGSEALFKVIRNTLTSHRDIVYNGDCYEQEYVEEMAKKRGLPNIPSCPAAFQVWNSKKNQELFSKLNVLTPAEVEARGSVWEENYINVRTIEVNTLINMVETNLIPAAQKYQRELALIVKDTEAVLGKPAVAKQLEKLVFVTSTIENAFSELAALKELARTVKSHSVAEGLPKAFFFRGEIMPAMEKLKSTMDSLESSIGREHYPLPTLTDMFTLFQIPSDYHIESSFVI